MVVFLVVLLLILVVVVVAVLSYNSMVRRRSRTQEELTATEDKIEYARRCYNSSARDYDTSLQTFPRNLIAGAFHLGPVWFFEPGEEDRAVGQVDFTTSGPVDVAPRKGAS
jgi:hypothetical protein